MISVIVFLGNPGRRYALTRHNYGWIVCEKFVESHDIVWMEKFNSVYADMHVAGRKIVLQKPLTWMNECGRSVQPLLKFFKIPIEDLLVIHDDLDLPFGRIEIKQGGGMAGHKGLRSLRKHLGTGAFTRLRLGIGKPAGISVSSYVLSRFSKEEEAELPDLTAAVRDIMYETIRTKKGE